LHTKLRKQTAKSKKSSTLLIHRSTLLYTCKHLSRLFSVF